MKKKPKRPLKTTPLDKMIESLDGKLTTVRGWRFDDTSFEQEQALDHAITGLALTIFALKAFKAFDK